MINEIYLENPLEAEESSKKAKDEENYVKASSNDEKKKQEEKDKKENVYIYKEILKKLVDIPVLETGKVEKGGMRQSFFLFFFFLISCKHELAKYVYEQERVLF